MIPNQKRAFARWIFGTNFHDKESYEPGKFRFSDREEVTTETGVSLTWQEYSSFLFHKWRVRRANDTIGGALDGGESYTHHRSDDNYLDDLLHNFGLSDQEKKRCAFLLWRLQRSQVGGASDGDASYTHEGLTRTTIRDMIAPVSMGDYQAPPAAKGFEVKDEAKGVVKKPE